MRSSRRLFLVALARSSLFPAGGECPGLAPERVRMALEETGPPHRAGGDGRLDLGGRRRRAASSPRPGICQARPGLLACCRAAAAGWTAHRPGARPRGSRHHARSRPAGSRPRADPARAHARDAGSRRRTHPEVRRRPRAGDAAHGPRDAGARRERRARTAPPRRPAADDGRARAVPAGPSALPHRGERPGGGRAGPEPDRPGARARPAGAGAGRRRPRGPSDGARRAGPGRRAAGRRVPGVPGRALRGEPAAHLVRASSRAPRHGARAPGSSGGVGQGQDRFGLAARRAHPSRLLQGLRVREGRPPPGELRLRCPGTGRAQAGTVITRDAGGLYFSLDPRRLRGRSHYPGSWRLCPCPPAAASSRSCLPACCSASWCSWSP